jgi:hypothetical protein
LRCTDQEERVAVRRRIHDHFGGNIAAAARPVLDDELLTKPLRQPLPYQARGDVGQAARGSADDQSHRPRRVGLRPRDPRHGRQPGSTYCQVQEFSTCKSHRPFPLMAGRENSLMIGHHFSASAFTSAPSASGVCLSGGKIPYPKLVGLPRSACR